MSTRRRARFAISYSIEVDTDECFGRQMVLPFWYLLEEALLDAEYVGDPQGELWNMAKMIYLELVKILKRKVTWPAEAGWPKGTLLIFTKRSSHPQLCFRSTGEVRQVCPVIHYTGYPSLIILHIVTVEMLETHL